MTVPGRLEDLEALPQLLHITLDAIVGVFEQASAPLPDRRYVAYGAIAADCEQLTVQFTQLYPGEPGTDPSSAVRCDGPRTAVLVCQLLRCVPTGSGPRGQAAPDPAIMDRSAEAFCRDAWLLLDAAQAVDAAGWNTGVIAEVSPVDSQGGFAGSAMTLTVTVP